MTFEEATYDAGLEIFRNLRDEDEWEISRLGDTGTVLVELVTGSIAYVARVDGIPACLYGVTPSRGGIDPAKLWLVTTPLVEKYKLSLAKMARAMVEECLVQFGVIETYVPLANKRALRWVSWLGFEGTSIDLPAVGAGMHFKRML